MGGLPQQHQTCSTSPRRCWGSTSPSCAATGAADGRTSRPRRWAQPAVLTCSVAAFGVLRDTGEPVTAVAGHSIGEYAALVVAGVLSLADAVRLVALRAAATDDAAHDTPGGMAAVMRAERPVIEEICVRTGAALAADNSAGQLVISGATRGPGAGETARERGRCGRPKPGRRRRVPLAGDGAGRRAAGRGPRGRHLLRAGSGPLVVHHGGADRRCGRHQAGSDRPAGVAGAVPRDRFRPG